MKTKLVSLVRRWNGYNRMSTASELRERIIRYAGPRFFEQGFSRITTEELARQLGISKKTLYREFSSKEEIVRTVVRRSLARVDAELNHIFDDETRSFLERFGAQLEAARRILGFISKPFMYDLSRYLPALWDEIQEFRRKRVFDRLENIIRGGQKEGMIMKEIHPELLVMIITTVADNLLVPDVFAEQQMRPQEVIRHVGILFSRGILTDYGRERLNTSGIIEGEY